MKNNTPIAELRQQVMIQAEKELDLCNKIDTPMVCKSISTPEGRTKILNLVVEYVGNSGQSISQAIVSIERELNPNSIE